MDYKQFNTKCVGITVEGWDYILLGIFTYVDEDWGLISPIPDDNPLSKQVRFVDSDMHFRLKDLKLIKTIKYVENKTDAPSGPQGYGPRFNNQSAGKVTQ